MLVSWICEALRLMYLKGLITHSTGSISAKVGDTVIIMSSPFYPTIKLKYVLKSEDLGRVDLFRKITRGKANHRAAKYLEIYRSCERCNPGYTL